LTAPATPPSTAHLRDAGLARRFAALGYEALLVVAMVLVASFALLPFVSPDAARTHALAVPTLAGRTIMFVALFALGGLFFGWCWSRGRRTLPMKTWRLALVDANGAPLSPRTAIVRYLAAWIGPALALAAYGPLSAYGQGALAWPLVAVNWLAAFVDPGRRFLHDRIAGTRIVMS